MTRREEVPIPAPTGTDGLLASLLIAAFLLTFAIVELSAYLRLQEAGTGCTDWPYCYGQLHKAETDQSSTPTNSFKKVHRGAASLLVLVTGLIAYRVFRNRNASAIMRESVLLMISLLVVLSAIGPYTPQKQYPLFAIANSVCGILLLAVIARFRWHAVALKQAAVSGTSWLRAWVILGLVLAIGVIASGAWSNVNFASLATTVEPDKAILSSLLEGFNPLRKLTTDADHRVLPDAAMSWMRTGHRVMAFVFAVVIVPLCLIIIYSQPVHRLPVVSVLLLATLEFLFGWMSFFSSASIFLALGHHFIAILMMLALLKLTIVLRSRGSRTRS